MSVSRPGQPVRVDGVSNPEDIANLFKDHFTVKSPLGPSCAVLNAESGKELGLVCTVADVKKIINSMSRGRSPGHDGLSIEHLRHAGPHLPRVLFLLFNLCVSHSYLPEDMIKTVVVPIV